MGKKRPRREPKKLSADVVEARTIVLVDENGKERVSLSCSGGDGGASGFTVIHVNDNKGRPVLTMQVEDSGSAGVCLFNRNNSPGISLGVNAARGGGLSIADRQGKTSIMIGASDAGTDDERGSTPQVLVIDSHGRRMWSPFDGVQQIQISREEDGKG